MGVGEQNSRYEVLFASERTLLAWVRTGIAMMALGFVVSRFGLFLERLAADAAGGPIERHAAWSAVLGVAFIASGSLAIASAVVRHRRFIKAMPTAAAELHWGSHASFMAVLIGLLGLILSAYLVMI